MSEPAALALPADLTERELRQEDAEAVAALISACDRTYLKDAPEGWEPPSEEAERARWRGILAEPGRLSRGAFDEEGDLVAMIAVRQASDEEGKPVDGVGHVSALFVHPSRWREGIASRLLAEGEELLHGRGLRQASLRTPEWAPARRFYEAQGWNPTGEREFAELWDMWTVRYEKPLGLA